MMPVATIRELEKLLEEFNIDGHLNLLDSDKREIPCPKCEKTYQINMKHRRESDDTVIYTPLYYCIGCETYRVGQEF